ncbi:dihydrolipoyl dehydrogenase family protein [Rhodococcus rhodochrous]|uniref:NAD(P)/FAD-dependent oxidoreductase n=1 Tax=Rhodococcus rhodochrous TaxID=1829 RepID=A0AA46WT00_RHORH|nr:NAD(P)/FAD-dependent oxidoreductase [Rhodococcus rhodochrous]MCB8908608.1 NAD(P)/FAD-dependent oxidoreductase [Rhodococcus rhodochrous]UZF43021.1 NAD(P)/FAD-dependent oxidoreductase [Rhodococcus rhodochrous]
MSGPTAESDSYDVIVLGAGPAGENAAQYAIAGSDRTAVLVEHELVGGECSYWACMPSKALLRPTQVLATARNMPGVADKISAHGVEVPAVLARRDSFTHNRDDSSQVDWAEGAGIDVVRGHGRLAGERTVTVTGSDGERRLQARHAVVLATGTVPSIPDLPGLRDALPWTSRDATNLLEVPRRVLVVGGGVVACETATWLRQLGAEELTLAVRGDRLLPRVEPFAAERVATRMAHKGLNVRYGTEIRSVQRPDVKDTGVGRIHGGPATVELSDGSTVEVDEIVVAAGRCPAVDGLGLDTVGLTDGKVTVADDLTVDGVDGQWLYAVGDIAGRAALTHMGKYQARVCGDVIAARAENRPTDGSRFRTSADHGQVPQVIFTVPEIAAVGRTAEQARADGLDVEVLEADIDVAGASLARDDYAGHAALVVDRATDTLVGATFVGQEVAELVHAATVALVGKVPLDTLWHAVPSYPTISEIWLRLLESRRS